MERGTDATSDTARRPVILVVEDDPAVLDVLTEALGDQGYEVRRATDGMAALAELQRDAPDLVLTDVHMPGLTGGQLVRRLRDRGVPAILLSADTNWSREPGVAFLSKPFDLDHLLTVVERLLDDPERR